MAVRLNHIFKTKL